MRQAMKEIEVNVAYRRFLGLDMMDSVPHFSTFGKNYTRRFKDTDLFEQIFSRILEECMKYKLVDTSQIFVDSTHVKACANSKKMRKTSVYKGYKQDKIEMRGDRAEMSDFPLYLNTVAGGLDRRDQTIGGFSFVVKIYAVPVVEIIGQLLYLLGRYDFNAQFSDCL